MNVRQERDAATGRKCDPDGLQEGCKLPKKFLRRRGRRRRKTPAEAACSARRPPDTFGEAGLRTSSVEPMRTLTKLTVALGVMTLSLAAAPTVEAQGGPTITIKDFIYDPADLAARVGQEVTVTNSDGFDHTITANDGTFDMNVPPNGSVTLKMSKAGSFPYTCTYHPGQHNPATINVS
jgi:plastocyanin